MNGRTSIDVARYTVLSRHDTSQGLVTWARCNQCGGLRMFMQPATPDGAAMTAGRHGHYCPNCGD
jgi:hypothetical protein